VALCLPDKVAEARSRDTSLYERSDYNMYGLNMSYLPGLAWMLLKLDDDRSPISLFNDI
jgi:hypothetical protein